MGIRWFARAVGLTSNPLRRRRDTVVAALVLGVLLIALVGVPVVAVVTGRASYEGSARAAEATAATRRQVVATVLTRPMAQAVVANPEVTAQRSTAEVRWVAADGAPRTGRAPVEPGTAVGAEVPLWVDTADRITAAPPTDDQLRAAAVGLALGVVVTGEGLCMVLLVAVRAAADALACRAWAREWEVVGPRWARQP